MNQAQTPQNYTKQSFIELALNCGVLKFGKFTLKSGRESPYFFNAGLFYQGQALKILGQFYAKMLIDNKVDCSQLFGPAYKGLPLATATSIALADYGINTTVTFNRKEIKDHGEGGILIGAPLLGNTVMIDDVITAGTAFREAQTLIQENGGHLTTVIIALDRCERGLTTESAISEIRQQGIEVLSVINLNDLIDYLEAKQLNKELELLRTYQQLYGA
ncbi:orotate phosphoribosyltransferase [Legionella sp. D16C41]|uniref:orotate phosphoribosyltransferase n=1 Tax=Legionella sp. D16C41 TaxID=3402688 RepID=UPI003AF6C1ED